MDDTPILTGVAVSRNGVSSTEPPQRKPVFCKPEAPQEQEEQPVEEPVLGSEDSSEAGSFDLPPEGAQPMQPSAPQSDTLPAASSTSICAVSLHHHPAPASPPSWAVVTGRLSQSLRRPVRSQPATAARRRRQRASLCHSATRRAAPRPWVNRSTRRLRRSSKAKRSTRPGIYGPARPHPRSVREKTAKRVQGQARQGQHCIKSRLSAVQPPVAAAVPVYLQQWLATEGHMDSTPQESTASSGTMTAVAPPGHRRKRGRRKGRRKGQRTPKTQLQRQLSDMGKQLLEVCTSEATGAVVVVRTAAAQSAYGHLLT